MRKIILIVSTILLATTSCNDDFLEEKPLDFLSNVNAYDTYEGLNATVNNLYWFSRRIFFDRDEHRPFDFIYGTDLVYDGQSSTDRHTNMIAAYDPNSGIPATHWDNLYTMVVESNIVISRAPVADITEEQQIEILAQARFFRAFAYRALVYIWGGVPLVTEEITEPRTDFVRASKEEVLNQIIEDLNYAANNLPGITEAKDGKLNNLAAQHLLSEVYLAANRPQDAVNAASVVINDPATALMQNRFGSRANETPGDVYWDLFRMNNQNRGSGNTEALWVIQFETDVLGGSTVSGGRGGSYMLERHHAPFIRNVKVNGESPFLWPKSDYTGGRGIGWAVPTYHFTNEIWESDFDNDIRNANHNFVREFTADNPNSSYYGQVFSTENPPEGVDTTRDFYAYQSKVTTPMNHPDGLYDDKELGTLKSSAGATYTDQYMFRMAETYLLRAEAYMDLGNNAKAAADINKVRERAHANPVAAGDVDIDYILDERMRELGVEEKRRLTLMRLGLLYDRVKRFNPYYADEILPKYNLWPIPAAEIERNIDAELEQNPGY
ncbi:RagB/SusD family nutrient uptake outer membrane protein [Galbibacter pacificus]|uniref:RagB/SusD family nutrient uptake outer membrane protein n=1 Tax=Galbibacter pacificus TaxID=2996052 RepID=A0ABT6FN24_9FLAO|nr:RagB/SusD family nutrient uptake outer membrane protein [Galbibacter pacificus]MDG3581189.1 RagB/SusD family nutrient uptake outer membrane protein [Galbibacter pacificus]MDG3584667.1 RagB/SusD family nutrient uptake outer membrane protein [Galbibacter pacificus]